MRFSLLVAALGVFLLGESNARDDEDVRIVEAIADQLAETRRTQKQAKEAPFNEPLAARMEQVARHLAERLSSFGELARLLELEDLEPLRVTSSIIPSVDTTSPPPETYAAARAAVDTGLASGDVRRIAWAANHATPASKEALLSSLRTLSTYPACLETTLATRAVLEAIVRNRAVGASSEALARIGAWPDEESLTRRMGSIDDIRLLPLLLTVVGEDPTSHEHLLVEWLDRHADRSGGEAPWSVCGDLLQRIRSAALVARTLADLRISVWVKASNDATPETPETEGAATTGDKKILPNLAPIQDTSDPRHRPVRVERRRLQGGEILGFPTGVRPPGLVEFGPTRARPKALRWDWMEGLAFDHPFDLDVAHASKAGVIIGERHQGHLLRAYSESDPAAITARFDADIDAMLARYILMLVGLKKKTGYDVGGTSATEWLPNLTVVGPKQLRTRYKAPFFWMEHDPHMVHQADDPPFEAALALMREGRFEKARELLEPIRAKQSESDPIPSPFGEFADEDVNAWLDECDLATGRGDSLDSSLRARLDRATETGLSPRLDREAWRVVRVGGHEQGLYLRALAVAETAVAQHDCPRTRHTLGLALYRVGRFADALDALTRLAASRTGFDRTMGEDRGRTRPAASLFGAIAMCQARLGESEAAQAATRKMRDAFCCEDRSHQTHGRFISEVERLIPSED